MKMKLNNQKALSRLIPSDPWKESFSQLEMEKPSSNFTYQVLEKWDLELGNTPKIQAISHKKNWGFQILLSGFMLLLGAVLLILFLIVRSSPKEMVSTDFLIFLNKFLLNYNKTLSHSSLVIEAIFFLFGLYFIMEWAQWKRLKRTG